ncbi:MAG TPA: hypothetical protein VKT77_13850, partial [Chthonomonadaceae bacterium]|nr:hypothetical protein [Chthonomonadaceae bacterium]
MTRAKLYIILLVTLIVALALSTAIRTTTPPPDAQTPPGQRQQAPDLSLALKPGAPPVTLASLRGK